MTQNRGFITIFLIALMVLGILAVGIYLFTWGRVPSPKPEDVLKTSAPSTSFAVGTLPPEVIRTLPKFPPPLASVSFPTEKISYPPDYPDELRFPPEFVLVETHSKPPPGLPPSSPSKIYIIMHRFKGSPKDAMATLMDSLSQKGWRLVEKYAYQDGQGAILFEGGFQGEKAGADVVFDVDPKDSSTTLVLSLIER